ncbi:DUF3800 domain-containing protein [Saccharothrix variisporea]|uniref:DUF3800 domain-containing protein n=1 Tax=Saccharothrix variisporea TaxID=543527 RepID=A0A495XGV0_9PSEU|nr:DUF3800 domain-containing protein [Saccharothrix variisporea]RKT71783.1 hypothetical protein DFJ66_5078 [Saccharothrix variisporea]
MTVHAFVDESRRQDTYYLAAAIIHPRQLRQTRSVLRGLLFPGQRELHFAKETPSRRKLIVSTLCELGVEVDIYAANCRKGEERARRECLTRLTAGLVQRDALRLVLDSREGRDVHDRETIVRVLRKADPDTPFSYEHFESAGEPLLWLADIVAWCHGAGGDWARRIRPVVGDLIRLDYP